MKKLLTIIVIATALAVAKISKKEFNEIPKLLPTNVVSIDVFQKQTRLALVAHSQPAVDLFFAQPGAFRRRLPRQSTTRSIPLAQAEAVL